MTELLFRVVLPMALAGSLLYLLLIALRPLWGGLGAKFRKTALLAVCALLLAPLPFLAASAFPAAATPTYKAGEALGQAIGPAPQPEPAEAAGGAAGKRVDAAPADAAATAPVAVSPTFAPRWPVVLAWAYLAGAAVFAGIFAVRYGRLARRLRAGRGPAGEDLMQEYRLLCAQAGLRRPPALYRSANIPTPLLAGILRPAIYLPHGMHDKQSLALALRHELAHYRKGDLLFKLAVVAASAIHWYLPLCALLRRDFAEACEEECDASAAALCLLLAGSLLAGCSMAAGVGSGFSASSSLIRAASSQPANLMPPDFEASRVDIPYIVGETNHTAPLDTPDSVAALYLTNYYETSFPSVEDSTPYSNPVPSATHYAPKYQGTDCGVKLYSPIGDPIHAAKGGRVLVSQWDANWGHYLLICHWDSYMTLYAHCDELLVYEGDEVAQNQWIATVGQSGYSETAPHCYFEIWSPYYEICDPRDYLSLPPRG